MPRFPNLAPVFGLTLALTVAHMANADLTVRFIEGAPKDRFQIENAGNCPIVNTALQLDLSTSKAGLIFDVSPAGEGVEVFQPFEIVAGADALGALNPVDDGQSDVTLQITELAPAGIIAFTIDVDDTLGTRAITVSGAEIEGATVRLEDDGVGHSAEFSKNAIANLTRPRC